jgi:hypothetical protein
VSAGSFIEADHCQVRKHGQNIAGDVFLSKKEDNGQRVISVLADGLGSGVEACVLASLTAQMAMEYVAGNIDTRKAAEIVMDALPICPNRKISYSTFTIVDTKIEGATRIIEHGNPRFLLIRNGECVDFPHVILREERWNGRRLAYSELRTTFGDRILFFSDGITQSGIGSEQYPFGWGVENVKSFVSDVVSARPEISARFLSQLLVKEALDNDGDSAGDDITCGVIYIRQPRQLLVLTGPPYDQNRDMEFANLVEMHKGKTVICGGTTANIIARLLKRSVTMDLSYVDPEVPCTSDMEGIDLVTEGCLTLGKTAEMLETGVISTRYNGATRFANMLLQNDIIHFVVGTRINEAHQNPNLPVELDIRRNVVKKIVSLLREKYLKDVRIDYI